MSLATTLARFTVVTVMEPTFSPIVNGTADTSKSFVLDSLSISNYTEEGPRKTARGGLNARVVSRFGKTARLEMEDVIGRLSVLEGLFNAQAQTVTTGVAPDQVTTITALDMVDTFSGYFQIVGKTFIVDDKTGDRKWIELTFHNFLPDGLFSLTMEAEGDFGLFNIGGELFTNEDGAFFTIKDYDESAPVEPDPDTP